MSIPDSVTCKPEFCSSTNSKKIIIVYMYVFNKNILGDYLTKTYIGR